VVDSVGIALVDTSHLKTVYTRSLFSGKSYSVNWGKAGPHDQDNWENKGKYVERLGGVWPLNGVTIWPVFGGFFPAVSTHVIEGATTTIEYDPYGDFRCYSDAAYSIKLGNVPCVQHFLSAGDLKTAKISFAAYPNPASGLFKVTCREPLPAQIEVQVTDIYGRTVSEGTWLKGKASIDFDLRPFAQGVYFVVLNMDGAKYYQKIILQR
jgi:hypothetical protein